MGKVKVTTWVDQRTAGVLRGLAAQNGFSMSELCAEKLKASVSDHAGEVGVEILLPAIRGTIRREVADMSTRVARLLARSALESATARRLMFQLLAEELGAEEANGRNRSAWTASVESLKKPAEGLREIMGETPGDGPDAAGVDREATI